MQQKQPHRSTNPAVRQTFRPPRPYHHIEFLPRRVNAAAIPSKKIRSCQRKTTTRRRCRVSRTISQRTTSWLHWRRGRRQRQPNTMTTAPRTTTYRIGTSVNRRSGKYSPIPDSKQVEGTRATWVSSIFSAFLPSCSSPSPSYRARLSRRGV